MPETLDQVLAALPLRFPGAGGAAAVLKDGQILTRHAWGYADLERRIPFSPATMFLICSITKQFTCATTLLTTGLDRDPDVLESALAARLPLLKQRPAAAHLAHNQSGLRDYWALSALAGSPVEAPFTEAQARRLTDRVQTLHFTPGTRYSYCNQNFRILGDLAAERAGTPLGDLMRKHVFDRAGMPTARLNADTSQIPGFTVGYEGSQTEGFRPAVNRITWTGDAGIAASLDDLIAWERHIDATSGDPNSIHARLSAPVAFTNGAPAGYGWGLARGTLLGRATFGHGGGLRGWRSARFYAPAERLSVVVLFNHMADPRAAATALFAAALGHDAPRPPAAPRSPGPANTSTPKPAWPPASRPSPTATPPCTSPATPKPSPPRPTAPTLPARYACAPKAAACAWPAPPTTSTPCSNPSPATPQRTCPAPTAAPNGVPRSRWPTPPAHSTPPAPANSARAPWCR